MDREFTKFAALTIGFVLLVIVPHPELLLSKAAQAGIGWGFLACLAASALCFTMVPTLGDIPKAAESSRRAGGQFAAAALMLALCLFLLFVVGLTGKTIVPGTWKWIGSFWQVVSFALYFLPALGLTLCALGVVAYACGNLGQALRLLLFPKVATPVSTPEVEVQASTEPVANGGA